MYKVPKVHSPGTGTLRLGTPGRELGRDVSVPSPKYLSVAWLDSCCGAQATSFGQSGRTIYQNLGTCSLAAAYLL